MTSTTGAAVLPWGLKLCQLGSYNKVPRLLHSCTAHALSTPHAPQQHNACAPMPTMVRVYTNTNTVQQSHNSHTTHILAPMAILPQQHPSLPVGELAPMYVNLACVIAQFMRGSASSRPPLTPISHTRSVHHVAVHVQDDAINKGAN